MKLFRFLLSLSILTIFLLTGCKKEENKPTPQTFTEKVASATKDGINIEIFAEKALEKGYNKLRIFLKDAATGMPINVATINFNPLMDMHSMKHGAPAENPSSTIATNGYFESAAVFSMPSGDMGSWTLEFKLEIATRTIQASIPVTVKEPKYSRLKTFKSSIDGASYSVALINPSYPKVGINDFEIAIFKTKNMMEFPADSSFTITMEPSMPSMGHGSPNNIDPVHKANGHYFGKVNFTMTGLWQVDLKFLDKTQVANNITYFEIDF